MGNAWTTERSAMSRPQVCEVPECPPDIPDTWPPASLFIVGEIDGEDDVGFPITLPFSGVGEQQGGDTVWIFVLDDGIGITTVNIASDSDGANIVCSVNREEEFVTIWRGEGTKTAFNTIVPAVTGRIICSAVIGTGEAWVEATEI